jgi:16S rRNA pseudouridine516 synthase
MHLTQLLFTQGFGTRRECDALIVHGQVEIGGRVVDEPRHEVTAEGLVFRV